MGWLEDSSAGAAAKIRDEKELWAVCPKCGAHFPREDYPAGLPECPACGER